jgi:RNA polymerase sigma-32 factor
MSQNSEVMVIRNTGNLPQVIEENSLFSYFEKIRKFPVLSENEETRLIRDFKENGDLTAAQKLITSHLRLAAKIALTYRRYGLPMADIVSEANIGLMQAVKKFDLDKKVRLATYAIWWIKAAINDYILRSWSLVKIGTVAAQKKLFYNLNRIKARDMSITEAGFSSIFVVCCVLVLPGGEYAIAGRLKSRPTTNVRKILHFDIISPRK